MEEQHPPFTPSAEDVQGLLNWFAAYDALVKRNSLDEMADEAIFPNVVITNDSHGEYVTQTWSREMFKRAMDLSAQGVDPTTVRIENARNPIFLNKDLAVVVTDSRVSTSEGTYTTRYVDVMVKHAGRWKFQAMVQGGWGDMLREHMR